MNWKSKFEYVDPTRGPAKPFPGWMAFTYFCLGWVTFGAFWIIWLIHYIIYKLNVRERRQVHHGSVVDCCNWHHDCSDEDDDDD